MQRMNSKNIRRGVNIMTELEYIEKMIQITQDRIDKAEYDIKHYVKDLNIFLELKRAVVERTNE